MPGSRAAGFIWEDTDDGRTAQTAVALGALLAAVSGLTASAQTVKIGLINSYSGFLAQAGDQMARRASISTSRSTRRICRPASRSRSLRRDDTAKPEVGKRLAQELITREHVQLLTGIVLSPIAAAVAPLTAEAKVPLVITIAAGAAIPRISPYVVRVSFTLWQQAYPIGKWAAEAGLEDRATRR